MEINQLEQLGKKSSYLSNKSAEQNYLIVLKNMNYLISSSKPTKHKNKIKENVNVRWK